MSKQEYSFYCAACGYVDRPIFRKDEKRMQTCPECGSRRIRKAPNNISGNPILPVHLQFKKKENETMKQQTETVTIKMKDERTPEEVMKNKAKIEHQLFKCENCNEEFEIEELQELYNVNGEREYEHLCEKCKESIEDNDEPNATVYFNDDEEPQFIRKYSDDTEGAFKAIWHRTDAWRGYYDVTSENWTHIHSDCILSGSYDSEQLKKFDDEFQAALRNMGIEYARVFSITSNVFSSGYDFFVKKGKEMAAGAVRVMLAVKYRDPERFRATALTGKDPDKFDEHDKLFVKAVSLLEQGIDPEDAVKKVMEDET